MTGKAGWYSIELRRGLAARNVRWAQGRAHVENYGTPPAIVYAPEDSSRMISMQKSLHLSTAECGIRSWHRRISNIARQFYDLGSRETRWQVSKPCANTGWWIVDDLQVTSALSDE